MHVDVALEQSAHCADRVVIEVVNTGGPQHTQASLDQGLLGYKQAANSHRRRWGGHGLGLRHTAAMLKLLECPPLSLTAEANTVTARFSMPYRPCPPSRSPSSACNALDESDACSNGGGGGGGGGSDGDGSGGGSGVNGDGCPAGEARAATAGQPGPRAPRLRSVLVVDDEEFIRTLTQLALEGQCEQCVVETAANGALAEPWAVGTLSLAPRLSPRLSRSVHPDPRADAGAGAEQARRVLRSSSSGAGWQTPPLPLARATSPRSTTSF